MYTFAVPVMFAFAVFAGSKATFIFATVTFIGAWLHYFCTEKPDFAVIYNN
jgi:hypothetical protein